MNRPTIGLVAIAVLALASSAISVAQTAPGPSTTPPPPPLPNTASQTQAPIITPTTAAPTQLPPGVNPPTTPPTAAPGRRGRRGGSTPGPSPVASPTDTPEPPQFTTMDGVWEVQMQPPLADRAVYSHFYVTQKGDALTGTWKRDAKTNLPFTGTFDGRLFKLTATDGAKTYTLAGYAENFGDMVGLFTDGDPKHDGTPFTASHRKKEKLGANS